MAILPLEVEKKDFRKKLKFDKREKEKKTTTYKLEKHLQPCYV